MNPLPVLKSFHTIFLANIFLFLLIKHYIESGDKYPRLYKTVKLTISDALFGYTRDTDAYIINSYYYPKSKSLGENGLAMVILINKNTMRDMSKYHMTLIASNSTDEVVVVPKFMDKESISPCTYVSIVAKANLLSGMTKLEIADEGTRMEIPFRLPRTSSPVPVIFCVSPQFLSEQWQLFVTHAHVARRFGGHVHLYITSMVGTYYHLVKEYEKHGYVTVDHWIRPKFPSSPDALEPNANSDWRNQPGANTDCLLQYKEAAKFIAFVDLDEVLFPRGFGSYYDEFSFLSFLNPHIHTFIYDRKDYLVHKHSKLMDLNFNVSFNHSYYSPKFLNGKPMARPSNIDSMSIHMSFNTPDRRRKYISDNFFLHLQKSQRTDKNSTDPLEEEFVEMKKLVGSHNNETILGSLQEDFERMMKVPEIQLISHNLQKDNFYLPLMFECYYGKNLRPGKCMNAEGCEIPQREDLRCVHTDADYVSGPRMRPITFHYHTNPKFLINVNCTT